MRRYKTPPAGTILPPQENLSIENPGTTTDQDKRNEWEQAQAQDRAYTETQLIADAWISPGGGFGRWLTDYQAGREFGPLGQGDPDAAPPEPPNGRAVEVKNAEAGGVYFDVVDSNVPACSTPKYERITAPQHYNRTERRKWRT